MSTTTNPTSQPPTEPPPSTHPGLPTHQQQHTMGIDIHKAIEILSARSQVDHHHHHHDEDHHHHHHGTGDSQQQFCEGETVPDNAIGMGQTIDLLAPTVTDKKSDESSGGSSSIDDQELLEEQRKKLEEERRKRRLEIQNELNAMCVRELLQQVMKAQQGRVATYRDYESGLTTVLQKGNMTTYPETCARATASFAVLSDSIKMVEEILGTRQRKDLAGLLRQLQSHEKEKLYLTAACHLERIRQRNHDFQPPQEPVADPGAATTADPRIAKLLSESVASLQHKIATSVESINEVLEELRCAMLEEEDEQ